MQELNKHLDVDPKRVSAKAPFSGSTVIGFSKMVRQISLVTVFILMSLPLFTTFNEILTKIVETTGMYSWLTQNVVPFETRAVSVVMNVFNINSKPTSTSLYIMGMSGKTNVFFSWNCLGWQSAVMLIATFITGLQGKSGFGDKVFVILLGISGTFMINIVRISTVVFVAYKFGQLPATIVHDYGGTLFTVVWFLLFWWVSYSYILPTKEEV
jgi:exosortase/archaeosortase family protein